MRATVVVLSGLFCLLTACQLQSDKVSVRDGGAAAPAPDSASVTPTYRCSAAPAPSCASTEASLRTMMLKAMDQRLAFVRQLMLTLNKSVLLSSSSGLLKTYNDNPGSLPGLGAETPEYSKTNNQVRGVQEADLVKTDGKLVYLAAGGTFRIVEAYPPASARIVARLTLPGRAHRLLLRGDRVVVYSLVNQPQPPAAKQTMERMLEELLLGARCASAAHHTVISIVDVAQRAKPRLVRQIRVPAALLAARRVGAVVHSILSSPDAVACKLRYLPSLEGLSKQLGDPSQVSDANLARAIDQALAKLRAANAKIIAQAKLSDWLPSITQTLHSSGKVSVVPLRCAPIFGSPETAASRLTTALSLDLSKETPASATVVAAPPGVVYSTASSLYLASSGSSCLRESLLSLLGNKSSAAGASSALYRLCLSSDPPGATFEASGTVPGLVHNQFSMDEHQGHLRVATTSGRCSSSGSNTLSVLKPQGGKLKVVGQVKDLARNEVIRAVRFQQDRGYVVTFRRIDPLFVFDLADPQRPTVLSELKVSGFATYMHSMDRDHLLTIGYEADAGTGRVQGMKLQIFDIKQPKLPRVAHSVVLGQAGSSSEALKDHLAVTYYPPRGLLAFPASISDSGGGYSGLMLYRATTNGGFDLRGQISHSASVPAGGMIRRSVVLGDYLLTVSDQLLKVSTQGTPPATIKELRLD